MSNKKDKKELILTIKQSNIMKTNYEVAKAFVNGEIANSNHLHAGYNSVASYWTTIAAKENGIILINCRDYSMTTRKHKSEIKRAANYNYFEVPNITYLTKEKHEKNLEYLCNLATNEYNRAAKCRKQHTKDFAISHANRLQKIANDYKVYFGI